MTLLSIREHISSRSMTLFGLTSSLRILWAAAATMVFVTRSSAAPAYAETDRAMMYLAQYGYLSPSVRNSTSGHILDESSWKKVIAEFQSFAGLNTTGELDEETVKLISLPRCGVKDKVGFGESRAKRYVLHGSMWLIKNLTYKISKYPSRLNHAEVDNELAKAFSVWSNYTDLTFTQKRSGDVHIEIRFVEGEHGDSEPFNGTVGVVAHAAYPLYGGDAHFDDAEMWSINSTGGISLFQVAVHEFGHSLGLLHSDVRSAVMTSYYRGYNPAFQLDQDDIQGIQALYGRKTYTPLDNGGGVPVPPVPRVTTPETPAEDATLCSESDPFIDTIFNSANGTTFVFKDQHYWRLTENGVASGYPRLISQTWPGLPGNIEAAFTNKNGKTLFFKGTKYWRYSGQKLDGDYPREISKGFTGIPDNKDAGLVRSLNGKICFYKGSKFWWVNLMQRPPVKSTYPLPLSN